MPAITFGGLSSGIDTDSIIAKLVQLESAASNRLKSQSKVLDVKAQVYGQLLTKISGVSQAVGRLNLLTAFNPVSATSSESTVAAITTTAGTATGTYSLGVTRLAQAQKLASTPQADVTSPLGKSGTIAVNGKAVRIDASDSLRGIADKINAAGAGTSATIIDGGPGSAYLTLTSAKSGAANKLRLADVSGTILSDLGVLGATDETSSGTSLLFTDESTAVGTLLGATGLGATNFSINGVSIAADLSTDSLTALADRINSSGSGATATLEAVSVDGGTQQRLRLSGATTLDDPDGTLHTIGLLQRSAGSELLAAQDASYTLDGVALTSATNSVSGAIPGATVNLLKIGDSTLTVTRDTATIKGNVNTFVQAANDALQYVKDASQFDAESYASGPLFGDSATRQFVSTFSQSLFANTGLPGSKYTNLAAIGFSIDKTGLVAVDDAAFDKALADRPDEVRNLFANAGKTTAPGLSFVSATAKTQASTGTGFDVSITQLATKSSFVAGDVQTAASTGPEILTFTGGAFPSAGVKLTLETGSTLASTVAKINADPRLKDYLTASIENGALRLDSTKYGTPGRFTVSSDQTATGSNSGVGPGGTGTKVDGLDIAGTIGGGAATGFGQFLTGDTTNTTASGLQVQYTGTSTGLVGSMLFSRGMATLLQESVTTFNDASNGLIVQAQKSLQDSVTSIQAQIDKNAEALARREVDLRTKFAAMETAIQKLQAQGQQLAGLSTNFNR